MMRSIIFFCLLSLLQGCNSEPNNAVHFPLDKGLRWEYTVTHNLTGEQPKATPFSIENFGPVKLTGEYENETIFKRHTSDGTNYYLLQDDTGTYRIGRSTLIEYQPRYEEQPVRVFPNEKDLDLGRSWSLQTIPYLLHSSGTAIDENAIKQPIMMFFEITDLNETITLPAGTFANCIRVEGNALLSIYVDPTLGTQDIPIKQVEWYAPGVGLIKLVREEPLNTKFYKGGEVTFELESFSD